jgi:hypothetical protein
MKHPPIESTSGAPPAPQKQVLLCSCPTEVRFARRLLTHFASCQQTSGLSIWHPSLIQPGSLWQQEVTSALDAAPFAVLLISPDFLAAPFILSHQLPRLLETARTGGTRIFSVICQPCLFEESVLAAFHPFNDPARPLSLLSPGARDRLWISLIRTLMQSSLLSSPPLESAAAIASLISRDRHL